MNMELAIVREAVVTGKATPLARALCEKEYKKFEIQKSKSEANSSDERLDQEIEISRRRVAKLEELMALQIRGDELERVVLWQAETRTERAMEIITKLVCHYFEQPMRLVVSEGRTAPVILPRQISFYLCRKLTDAALDKIGRMFDGRDHGTVFHGEKAVMDKMSIDRAFKKTVEQLEVLCGEALKSAGLFMGPTRQDTNSTD